MQYKTLKQQCEELLAARRYDELQDFLSTERAKIAVEMNQSPSYIPAYLPKWLIRFYAKLLPAIWAFRKDRPSLLQEEARLAHQGRRIETLIEMEQNLLEALNREAIALHEAARTLEQELGREKGQAAEAGDE